MRSKTLAITVSSFLAVFLTIAIDQIGCVLRSCVQDASSNRAEVFMVPMLVAYLVLSWLAVFPAIIALGKRMPKPVASLAVSLLSGLLVTFLLHRPTIDGPFIHTVTALLPWLVVPWLTAGWVATVMWPNTSCEGDMPKAAPPHLNLEHIRRDGSE